MSYIFFSLTLTALAGAQEQVYFQAHRGGLEEMPENTIEAFNHAWAIKGAVPEADLRTTADGVIICIHDATPARTLSAPPEFEDTPIARLPWDRIRTWDAAGKFAAEFAGARVPTLRRVFEAMQAEPGRMLYLDPKDVRWQQLESLIEEYRVADQVLFAIGSQQECLDLKKRMPHAGTMTWLSGLPLRIEKQYRELAAAGFKGIDQLQLHLHARNQTPSVQYILDDAFLKEAVAQTKAAGVELQLRPFKFDHRSLRRLLEIGVTWFVTDAPAAFRDALNKALALP